MKILLIVKMVIGLVVGVILLASAVALVSYLILRASGKPKQGKKMEPSRWKESAEKVWKFFKHPASFVFIGIVIMNWLTWTLSAGFWNSLWSNQGHFWSINIGLWLCFLLLLVKGEGGKGVHPIAKKISVAISIMLSFILIYAVHEYCKKNSGGSTQRGVLVIPAIRSEPIVPMEIALPIIADAETGGCEEDRGHQFEADGKTPVRNPKNRKAVGKWQINLGNSRVVEIVGSHMLNVEESEADNRKAAEYLYNESGTNPWLASKSCWGPKLAAWTGGVEPGKKEVYRVRVEKDWGSEIENPKIDGHKLRWRPADMNLMPNCEVKIDGQQVYPCNAIIKVKGKVRTFQFRSKAEPFVLEIELSRKEGVG